MSSACCGAAAPSSPAATAEATASAALPCCGDPTPNAETGACCSAPSATCGCQTKQKQPSAPAAERAHPGMHPVAAEPARLPVAIVGAGPIGLAAAVQLVAKGETPLVLEAGDTVGASMREWAHVRLFSPWKYLVEPTMRGMLEARGWRMPDEDSLPTGGELVAQLIEPLAALPAIAPHIRLGHRVVAVTRRGYDKVKTTGRSDAPFEIVVRTSGGDTKRILARAVIDASGTWRMPNPMGAGGVAAEGEHEAAANILYGIPDTFGRDRTRYTGKRTLVVGSGHSAFNALLDLAALGEQEPGTRVTWAVRRKDAGLMFGGGKKDKLPARGALGARLERLVDNGRVAIETGVRIARVLREQGALVVETDEGRRVGPFDEIVVATGFRPDLSLSRELRVKLDPWLEAPEQLAPLVDPNLHSCGTVYPHGARELAHPEQDYYVVGMKSYGRAPTFLLLTGYEQVRSVACALTGDEEGARDVELVLPETGVCVSDLGNTPSVGERTGGVPCCGTPAPEEDDELALVGAVTAPPALVGRVHESLQSAGCCR